MDDQFYRDVVSGRRRGAAAGLLRAGLRAASVPYSLAVGLRNRAFDLRLKRAHRVEVPVVSVGNVTLGGTGKTPLVEYLARWFLDQGVRVCILSRGYGARDGRENDEARVLAENLPGVPHLQGPDRVALARRAIDQERAEVLILDDGFQHRRLARDLDLVLLDALDPVGNGRLFPRGLLREPLSSLHRADLVVLNRADLLSDKQKQHIYDHCAAARRDPTGTLPWVEIAQRPCRLIKKREAPGATAGLPSSAVAGTQDVTAPRSAPRIPPSPLEVAAFCGIGNPAGFRRTLERLGWSVKGFRTFPDHHAYTSADISALSAWVAALGVEAVVTTQKDLVKFDNPSLGDRPLFALTIEVEILRGADLLHERLEALAQRARPHGPHRVVPPPKIARPLRQPHA